MGTFGSYTGNMYIEEEKKEEFCSFVERLLNVGGMMQFKTVKMYGKEVVLLKPLEIHSDEQVCFHFNYFEDEGWETACFNARNAIFHTEKIGSSEFCDVCMAVYFLYEVYTENHGITEVNGAALSSQMYVGWINYLLGTKFSMKERFKIWDHIEKYALPRVGGYGDVTEQHVMNLIPQGLRYAAGGVELSDLMYILHGTDTLSAEDVYSGTYPYDVYHCKMAIKSFLDVNSTPESINKIWSLIKKSREDRWNSTDSEIAEIAEFSMFLPARVIVYLAAELTGENFWKYWKELNEVVYHDEIMKTYASKELLEKREMTRNAPILPVRTSEFLRQDGWSIFFNTPEELKGISNYYISDDDRMYWWDGTDEVILSKEADVWLKALANEHKRIVESLIEEPEVKNDFLQTFLSLLDEIDQYYKRIYTFQSMFYDFLQNCDCKEYRAAVELLKQVSESCKESGKIIEKARYDWSVTSRNVTHNEGRMKVKRYLSVMANEELRRKYFGF